jgi:hypothetical protein
VSVSMGNGFKMGGGRNETCGSPPSFVRRLKKQDSEFGHRELKYV